MVTYSLQLSLLEHTGAARKRDDKVLRFYSANFDDLGIIEVSLDNLTFDMKDSWTNYPKRCH